jgi:hypothetical protein
VPAVIGSILALQAPRAGPASAFGVRTGRPGPDLLWPAASVVLAVVLALVATRGARRPSAGLTRAAWTQAGGQVGYGLFVAVLVVFPAIDQLVDPGFDPLPLSVTLVALPLVLGMGLAESLVLRFRARCAVLLVEEWSTARFAHRARLMALGLHLKFACALATATVALGAAVVFAGQAWDPRLALLGADYLVLGTVLFAATLLRVLGGGDRVLLVVSGGVTALAAFLAHGGHQHVPGTSAIIWHTGVGVLMLLVLAVQVRRSVGIPVRHR